MRFLCLLISLGWAGSLPSQAQGLEALAAEHETKLEHTLEAVRKQREAIATERLPFARALEESEQEARKLRKEAFRIQRRRDSMVVDLESLRKRTQAQQEEIDYIVRSLIPEYLASWDASLSLGKRAPTGELLRLYYLERDKADQRSQDKLARSLEMLTQSLTDLNEAFGGQCYAGKALDEKGGLREVTYAQVGPLLYAGNLEEKLAGFLEETDTAYPRLAQRLATQSKGILVLLKEGTGVVPVDPTLGEVQALEQTRDSLVEHLEKGGLWVYPILLFALVSTFVAFAKSIQIFGIRSADVSMIHPLVLKLRSRDKEGSLALSGKQPEPTRSMLEVAAENAGESVELIEELMYERILATQPRLERFLNVIAVTAATAPLLGLLGTVTGIIKTFELMGIYGAGDPKPLISGISEALITTELGLVLAIPALVLHALLSRRVSGILARMEQTAMAIVNGLSRKAAQSHE